MFYVLNDFVSEIFGLFGESSLNEKSTEDPGYGS